MRSQLFKTLIAVAVASTLTACASGNRDTSADTAAVDSSMTGSATMDQVGTASTSPGVADNSQMTASASTQVPPTQGVADSSQMTTSGSTQADTTASSQMGASASGQTSTSGQQYPATGQASTSSQQYPASGQATTASGTTQAGATESSQWSGSQGSQAGTMSGQAGMDGQISAAGAMKTEMVEGTQMGASTGGMTASSMDQQAVCGMYAQLKSARSTEEREKVMTQILLNVPRGDSALVDVREQCASPAP